METENDMRETIFQIAARIPETRKKEFEEYLVNVNQKRESIPKETIEDILQEAERNSNKLAGVFLSQSLKKHDPTTISNRMNDIMNFVKKDHFDPGILGDSHKFYLKYDKMNKKETFLESIIKYGMIKQREDVIYVMVKVDFARYGGTNEQKHANFRISRQVKKAIPSSAGLRDCLRSVSDRFPWGRGKFYFYLILHFLTNVVISGMCLYGLDVYTDIRFSTQMLMNVEENVKENATRNECSEEGQHFPNNFTHQSEVDRTIAGIFCFAHCALPFLVSFLLWHLIQFHEKWSSRSWTKLPLPFLTKIQKFKLVQRLLRNNRWSDRNVSKETRKEYEEDKKKILDEIEEYEKVVVLSLLTEASFEASFQVHNI